MSRRRVVVTGMGTVNPLANTLEATWPALLAGQSGVCSIDEFDTTDYRSKIAAPVKGFELKHCKSSSELERMDVFIQYGFAAALEAVHDAGLEEAASLDRSRIGVCMGAGIGGLSTIERTRDVLVKAGPRRVSPFFIPASIINMTAGCVSIYFGFQGPNLAVATACTTGTHAIGLGFRSILYGDADAMVVGGSEKASTPLGMSGFAAARALSVRNDAPQKASRPWDRDRDGFVLGDGAGVLVLEEYEHAKARRAKIYAELVGFGMSGDAYHMTKPAEGAAGAVAAMRAALKDASMNPEAVGYVNAHATSTAVGDVGEVQAIKTVFGEKAYQLAVSSTKSMTGHLLGAAGAVEAIFTILALRDQVVPPTINLDCPDEGCDLNLVPHESQPRSMEVALSNSFGFGGTNGTLIFKRFR